MLESDFPDAARQGFEPAGENQTAGPITGTAESDPATVPEPVYVYEAARSHEDGYIELFADGYDLNGHVHLNSESNRYYVAQELLGVALANVGRLLTRREIMEKTDFCEGRAVTTRESYLETGARILARDSGDSGLFQAAMKGNKKLYGIGADVKTYTPPAGGETGIEREALRSLPAASEHDEEVPLLRLAGGEPGRPDSIEVYDDRLVFNGHTYGIKDIRARRYLKEFILLLDKNQGIPQSFEDLARQGFAADQPNEALRIHYARDAGSRIRSFMMRKINTKTLIQKGRFKSVVWYGIGVTDPDAALRKFMPAEYEEQQARRRRVAEEVAQMERQVTMTKPSPPKEVAPPSKSGETAAVPEEVEEKKPAWPTMLTLPLTPLEREVVTYFQRKNSNLLELADVVQNAAMMVLSGDNLRKLLGGVNAKAEQFRRGVRFYQVVKEIDGEKRTFISVEEINKT